MDIFYNLNHIKDIRAFLEDCVSKSYKTRCDELDCSKSFSRVNTEKTLNEILGMISESRFVHCVFIIRNPIFKYEKQDIEAGLRLTNGIDYFIWINIEINHLDYFTNKYELKG